MKLRVLDLFSGIGGFSLGLERAGMTTVRFIEQNKFCQSVLAKHWPQVPIDEDVCSAEFTRGEADIIVGGFPCQDISLGNTAAAGIAGARSGLFREVVRAICLVRPEFTLLENVAELLGRGMGQVLGPLAESGLDAEWDCIPAATMRAPHVRDRIWIIAYAGGQGRKGLIDWHRLFGRERETPAEHSDPFADARLALAGDRTVLRTRDGVPLQMERDRVQAVGNSLLPLIPEIIGRAIMESIKAP